MGFFTGGSSGMSKKDKEQIDTFLSEQKKEIDLLADGRLPDVDAGTFEEKVLPGITVDGGRF